eukprot:gene16575-22808_t
MASVWSAAVILSLLPGIALAITNCPVGPTLQVATNVGDIGNDFISADGLNIENCVSHELVADAEECKQDDSVLILEWWALEANGSSVDSLTTISQAFFLAAMGNVVPEVYFTLPTSRRYSLSPRFTTVADRSLSGTYHDAEAVQNQRSYQRVIIPLGLGLQDSNVTGTWQISVSNLGYTWLDGYRIRASCLSEPICPRPNPEAGQCMGASQGTCQKIDQGEISVTSKGLMIPTCGCKPGFGDYACPDPQLDSFQGEISVTFKGLMIPTCGCKPGFGDYACPDPQLDSFQGETSVTFKGLMIPTCGCKPGYGDYACNAQIHNLSNFNDFAYGEEIKIALPPSTWMYFNVLVVEINLVEDYETPSARMLVDVEDYETPSARMLVELQQPQGSFAASRWLDGYGVQGALTVAHHTTTSLGEDGKELLHTRDVPLYSQISGAALYMREPFLPEDYTYTFLASSHLTNARSWWVGVYNAVQRPSAANVTIGSTPKLTLRVRWSPAANNTNRTFCPSDCSGRGTCQNEGLKSSEAGYYCQCQGGIGGPRCEGAIQEIPITADKDFNSDLENGDILVAPYTWQFYMIPVTPSSSKGPEWWYDTLEVRWHVTPLSDGSTSQEEVYFVSNRYYEEISQGLLYFDQSEPEVATTREEYSVNIMFYSPPHYSWFVWVYNAENVTRAYSLSVKMVAQTNKDLFRWQLGLGVAVGVCGLIALVGSCYIMTGAAFRRRAAQRSADYDIETGLTGGHRHEGPMAPTVAVPLVVVESFPVFKYGDPRPASPNWAAAPYVVAGGGGTKEGDKGGPPSTVTAVSASPKAPSSLADSGATVVDHLQIPLVPMDVTTTTITAAANNNSSTESVSTLPGWAYNPSAAAPTTTTTIAPSDDDDEPCVTGPNARGGGNAAAGGVADANAEPTPAPAANDDYEEDTCSVCIMEYGSGDQLRQLPCCHYFHKDCIDMWMQRNASCPICRHVLVEEHVLAAELQRERLHRETERTRRRAARRAQRSTRSERRSDSHRQESSQTTTSATNPTTEGSTAAASSTTEMTNLTSNSYHQSLVLAEATVTATAAVGGPGSAAAQGSTTSSAPASASRYAATPLVLFVPLYSAISFPGLRSSVRCIPASAISAALHRCFIPWLAVISPTKGPRRPPAGAAAPEGGRAAGGRRAGGQRANQGRTRRAGAKKNGPGREQPARATEPTGERGPAGGGNNDTAKQGDGRRKGRGEGEPPARRQRGPERTERTGGHAEEGANRPRTGPGKRARKEDARPRT